MEEDLRTPNQKWSGGRKPSVLIKGEAVEENLHVVGAGLLGLSSRPLVPRSPPPLEGEGDGGVRLRALRREQLRQDPGIESSISMMVSFCETNLYELRAMSKKKS